WWPMPAIGLCAHPRMLAVGPGAAAASDRLWVACGWEGLAVSDDPFLGTRTEVYGIAFPARQ
ncbi:MAG: hypothetical protein ACOYOH_24795, partial [Paracraurococcus sp.]